MKGKSSSVATYRDACLVQRDMQARAAIRLERQRKLVANMRKDDHVIQLAVTGGNAVSMHAIQLMLTLV